MAVVGWRIKQKKCWLFHNVITPSVPAGYLVVDVGWVVGWRSKTALLMIEGWLAVSWLI